MKSFFNYLILSIVIFSYSRLSASEDSKNWLDVEGTYVGDVVGNLSGGIKQGTAYLGMVNVKLATDFEKLNLWNGGQLYLNFANTHGDSPSTNLTGEFQLSSNIEAGDHTFFQEFWYSHQISNTKLTIGLQDLNVELANSEHGALYRNSSFGVHSTISDNIPSPVFPLTTLGLTFDWQMSRNWLLISAIYDGSPTEFENNSHNLSWKISKADGYLWLNELHKEHFLSTKLKGTIKLGVYYHNHWDTNDESEKTSKENYGFYSVIDQWLVQRHDGSGIALFSQMSYSSKHANNHFCYVGGGINFYGCGRWKSNVLGLAFANAIFRQDKASESIFEVTYKAVLGENIYLQPDFQFILNPSGSDVKLKNTAVTSLRFGLRF